MTNPFPKLFSPIMVGRKEFKNRVVNTGHTLLMNEHVVSETYHHYLVERARGGAAAIIMESSPVHPSSITMFGGGLELWREEIIPGFQRLSEAVHQFKAQLLVLLWHSGHNGSSQRSGRPLLAPSPIPSVVGGEVPKEIEPEEIDEIVDHYARAAQHARAGGLDGVEIQMADDYLLGSFLSPVLNRRTDAYGGSLDNRLRMVRRVMVEVRRAVGSDSIVGLRLSGDYMIPGDQRGVAGVQEAVRSLAATGQLDYFSVMAGSHYNDDLTSVSVPSYYKPLLNMIPYAVAIKEVTNLPVIGAGRIRDPATADELVASGKVDLVGLVRPLIADPEWPVKASTGRADDIRPCVYNNHCRASVSLGLPGTCIHNAAMGREREWGIGTLRPAERSKSVMIAGGGPAGMEAARVASLRGHRVTLYERGMELGGQVRFYKQVLRATEFYGIVSYLEGQLHKLGCAIHLGIEVTPDLVTQAAPEVVVVATGSSPLRTWFGAYRPDQLGLLGEERARVLTSWEVFDPSQELGSKVVVIADGGQSETPATVEYLAQIGKQVTLVTPELAFGLSTLGPMGEFSTVNKRLAAEGVEILAQHAPVEILSPSGVRIRHIFTQVERIIEADTVVMITMRKANDALYQALKGQVAEVHRIGDCVAPRYVHSAIVEGHRVGRSV